MANDASTGTRNVSGHILPTAGTMLGICTTLIGLVKLHEHHAGASQVDAHGGLVAIVFLISAVASYAAMRLAQRERLSLWLERAADSCFVVGLMGLAAVSVVFAWELI